MKGALLGITQAAVSRSSRLCAARNSNVKKQANAHLEHIPGARNASLRYRYSLASAPLQMLIHSVMPLSYAPVAAHLERRLKIALAQLQVLDAFIFTFLL